MDLKLKKAELRSVFFHEHTIPTPEGRKLATAPHDLFEWFWGSLMANMESVAAEVERLKGEREALIQYVKELKAEAISDYRRQYDPELKSMFASYNTAYTFILNKLEPKHQNKQDEQ